LLFQVFSQRYESGSTIVTTNQPNKNWPKISNNDSTLTSAVLDRLLHHAETVIVEGRSYRLKDQIETPRRGRSPVAAIKTDIFSFNGFTKLSKRHRAGFNFPQSANGPITHLNVWIVCQTVQFGDG